MFERFTDRARRVVVLAQEEARMLSHNYIGTEHILLGLIHEGEGVAAKALESMNISLEAVRQQVEEIIGQGQAAPTGHIPFTPRAKKVLELSLREALSGYVGHARKVAGGGRRTRRSSGSSSSASTSNTKDVREWAKAQGMEVSERGRISADVQQAYDAAH
ncbi:MAG TPA: histone-like nucleoid-structuring protein Lsr2 [Nocardioides sp.]|nr:histone-like nucleoid-structuring protein Lsr2 [Nocardioides sp.]